MSNTICNTPSQQHPRTHSELRVYTSNFGESITFSLSYIASLTEFSHAYLMDEAHDVLVEHGMGFGPGSLGDYSAMNDDGEIIDWYVSHMDACFLLLELLSTDDAVIALNKLGDAYTKCRRRQLPQFIADHHNQ